MTLFPSGASGSFSTQVIPVVDWTDPGDETYFPSQSTTYGDHNGKEIQKGDICIRIAIHFAVQFKLMQQV